MHNIQLRTSIQTLIVLLLLVSACSGSTQLDSADPSTSQLPPGDTPAVLEERTLNICIAEEPESLFLYGASSKTAASIFQAIYDGPIDNRSYAFQPVILEKLPSLADGDAFFEAVQVNPGDLIVDAAGNFAQLEGGVSYLPSGCKDAACAALYSTQDGQPIFMDQQAVAFSLLPGITWSDGIVVSAEDSAFSFEVAKSMPESPRAELVSHTFSYQILAANTVEWRGLPGYRDPNYATNFFTPLPKHAWGQMSAEALLAADITTKSPLGYGPYMVTEWAAGQSIKLSKNPSYFRTAEGLPHFDTLEYHFTGPDGEAAIDALLSGQCDILDESINLESQIEQLLELQAQGQLQLTFASGDAWEHLDFGIVPVTYDEIYNVSQGDRPDFFGDVRTRQAIAMCIDRAALVEQFAYGQADVLDTYIPASHPLFNPDAPSYSYDPGAGSALLEQVGWLMGENGIRVSQGVAGIPDGVPFAIDYFTTGSGLHFDIAQAVGQDLAGCGIQINILRGTPQELFAPGPDGLLFGRQFDLAQFAWPLEQAPSCFLFLGEAIPGGDVEQFTYSWGGWNLTGWVNSQFDAACKTSQNALPGEAAYLASHYLAQQIFASELPVIPLFITPKFTAARPDLCGLTLDPSANLLWNLESLDYGESC